MKLPFEVHTLAVYPKPSTCTSFYFVKIQSLSVCPQRYGLLRPSVKLENLPSLPEGIKGFANIRLIRPCNSFPRSIRRFHSSDHSRFVKGGPLRAAMASNKKASKPKKPPLTHFLCLPLVTTSSRPLLEESLGRLKDEVELLHGDALGTESLRRAVRPLGTIHLTLGVMSLKEQDSLEKAVGLLKGIDLKQLLY